MSAVSPRFLVSAPASPSLSRGRGSLPPRGGRGRGEGARGCHGHAEAAAAGRAAAPPRGAHKARQRWQLQTWNPEGLGLGGLGPSTELEVRGGRSWTRSRSGSRAAPPPPEGGTGRPGRRCGGGELGAGGGSEGPRLVSDRGLRAGCPGRAAAWVLSPEQASLPLSPPLPWSARSRQSFLSLLLCSSLPVPVFQPLRPGLPPLAPSFGLTAALPSLCLGFLPRAAHGGWLSCPCRPALFSPPLPRVPCPLPPPLSSLGPQLPSSLAQYLPRAELHHQPSFLPLGATHGRARRRLPPSPPQRPPLPLRAAGRAGPTHTRGLVYPSPAPGRPHSPPLPAQPACPTGSRTSQEGSAANAGAPPRRPPARCSAVLKPLSSALPLAPQP